MTPPLRSEDVSIGDEEFDVLGAMEVAADANRELQRDEDEARQEADLETFLDGRE